MAVSLFDVMARTIMQADTPAEVPCRSRGAMSFFDNLVRPHWSLSGQPPTSRVPVNNLTEKNS